MYTRKETREKKETERKKRREDINWRKREGQGIGREGEGIERVYNNREGREYYHNLLAESPLTSTTELGGAEELKRCLLRPEL